MFILRSELSRKFFANLDRHASSLLERAASPFLDLRYSFLFLTRATFFFFSLTSFSCSSSNLPYLAFYYSVFLPSLLLPPHRLLFSPPALCLGRVCSGESRPSRGRSRLSPGNRDRRCVGETACATDSVGPLPSASSTSSPWVQERRGQRGERASNGRPDNDGPPRGRKEMEDAGGRPRGTVSTALSGAGATR